MRDVRFCLWFDLSHDDNSHLSDTSRSESRLTSWAESPSAIFCGFVPWCAAFDLVPLALTMSNVDDFDDCGEKKRSFGSFWEGLLCAVLWIVVANCPKWAVDFVRIRSFLIKMHVSLISHEFLICDIHTQLLWWNIAVGNFGPNQTKSLTIAFQLTSCWWCNDHISFLLSLKIQLWVNCLCEVSEHDLAGFDNMGPTASMCQVWCYCSTRQKWIQPWVSCVLPTLSMLESHLEKLSLIWHVSVSISMNVRLVFSWFNCSDIMSPTKLFDYECNSVSYKKFVWSCMRSFLFQGLANCWNKSVFTFCSHLMANLFLFLFLTCCHLQQHLQVDCCFIRPFHGLNWPGEC